MKVSEMIRQLSQADGDLEIMVSPMIAMPTSELRDGEITTEGTETLRVPSPFKSFEIAWVGEAGSFDIPDRPEKYVTIGFELDSTLDVQSEHAS